MDIRGILWNTSVYSLLMIHIHSQLSSSEELPLLTHDEADSDKSECHSQKFILLSMALLGLDVVVV